VLKMAAMSKLGACLSLILLAACGGSHPPADAPKAPDSAEASADKSADADAGTEADAKPTKAAAKPDDEAPKTARSAQDILTSPDVVFMFSFNESDVKQTADSKCTASSGNDAKKMNQCMAAARKAIDVDGYRFQQKDGKWFWITIRVKGKVLATLHKFEVEFGPETPGSVVLKPKGKDLGSAPGRTPASITFTVPNEDEITLNDPKLGKLVYEAKIGTAKE
jgi:hypothetical protein